MSEPCLDSPSINDRETVIRPLKVTGLIGAFNVFAIARGGGTTGQAGSVSLGIAKALAAHVPDVELILRKGPSAFVFVPTHCAMRPDTVSFTAKLLRRDPRMVERKKTNLVKARKAVSLRAALYLPLRLVLMLVSIAPMGQAVKACAVRLSLYHSIAYIQCIFWVWRCSSTVL